MLQVWWNSNTDYTEYTKFSRGVSNMTVTKIMVSCVQCSALQWTDNVYRVHNGRIGFIRDINDYVYVRHLTPITTNQT